MDEFFVYPFCDTRPLRALTEWLDNSSVRSFGAMQIDMYPKGELQDTTYEVGQNPFEIAKWFDTGNYTFEKNENMGNLWIQGGPRARKFFPDAPKTAPALNKIPLVKWQRGYVYESSTHTRIRNLDGFEQFLKELKNIGMHPQNAGEFNDPSPKQVKTVKKRYTNGSQ